jgi:hypothetical protein
MDFPEEFLQRKSVDGSIEDPPLFFGLFIVSNFFSQQQKRVSSRFDHSKGKRNSLRKVPPKG